MLVAYGRVALTDLLGAWPRSVVSPMLRARPLVSRALRPSYDASIGQANEGVIVTIDVIDQSAMAALADGKTRALSGKEFALSLYEKQN